MELRNAVSKETLRKYLLTSSAEAIPQARPSLLSCFTNAENPKPQLQDRLSAAGEALESCSETALQSWFDPLEILLDQEAGTLAVRFPHAFFGIRFSSLFQKLFEKKARELWGKGLSITYGAGKFTPSPPVPFVQPAPESRQDALHPAVANPMPFGEEWTFDTFIGNGKHKWALSLARDITRRAVYRATHGRAPSLDDIGEAPGLLVLCGPHGTGKTHLLRVAKGYDLAKGLACGIGLFQTAPYGKRGIQQLRIGKGRADLTQKKLRGFSCGRGDTGPEAKLQRAGTNQRGELCLQCLQSATAIHFGDVRQPEEKFVGAGPNQEGLRGYAAADGGNLLGKFL